MSLELIKTKDDFEVAIHRLVALMDQDPPANSPLSEEIELLMMLIEQYEGKLAPPSESDAIDHIEFALDQFGLTVDDLIPIMGSETRLAEVMARRRPLTLGMIRKLHTKLRIPLQFLLAPYPVQLKQAS